MGMGRAAEMAGIVGRHNPVDPSRYHLVDPRDKPDPRERVWELECGEPHHPPRLWLKVPKAAAAGPLEAAVRAVIDASNEKPRWQKIVEHANSLAERSEMTREQFYSTALIEFIERLENERIAKEMNEAYKGIDQEEDLEFLRRAVRSYDPRLADE